jgi:hypothetical protein
MQKLLLELREENGLCSVYTANNWFVGSIPLNMIAAAGFELDKKAKLKKVIKLKEAGFTADEIFELIEKV